MKILKSRKHADGTDRTAATALRLSLRLMLVLLLIFALVGVVLQLLQQQGERARGLVQVAAVAQGMANKLSTLLDLHRGILVRFVQNSDLAPVLEAEDWDAIGRQEAVLQRLLPEVDAVRFLPFEWDKLNPKAVPPISFATLEMLRTVERSRKPSLAEVHQLQAQPYIALAAPVFKGKTGEMAGVGQLVLPMRVLHQLFDPGSEYAGAIMLQQVLDSGQVTLAESGGGGVDADTMEGEVTVPGTLWRLVYRGGSSGQGSLEMWVTWGVLVAALTLAALIMWLFVHRLGGQLKRDADLQLSLLRALLAGGGERPPPLAAVPELQGVMELLARPGVALKVEVSMPAKKREEVAAVVSAVEKARRGVEPAPAESEQAVKVTDVSVEIFRAYDIRGIVDRSLTADVVYQIGRAIGSIAGDQGEQTVIIGRDGRNSSESFAKALARGLMESGRDVVDIGLVPTPTLYFATHFLGSSSGVMVTGSHNGPEYNGLKIVIAGESLSMAQIKEIYRRIVDDNLSSGHGTLNQQDLVPDYISRITEDVQLLAPLKLVVDCGNGAASVVAPSLFRALGCDVTNLYCEVDGNFPNHHPNPGDPKNMQALIRKVKETGADLGVAFDGDGDRLGVVDSQGRIIWPDRLLMLLARDVLLRHPGADVIYDVKSSRNLATEILTYGGRPIMWKSGHSLVKAKMRETGALLAAEMSGHIYFKERWYGFDDGLYACARLLEMLSAEGLDSAEVFSQFPENIATPEYYAETVEGESYELMRRLSEQGQFPGAKLVTIDGIRAEYEDGWGLVRASNTTPALVFRFEAEGEAALARIQGEFREQFAAIAPNLRMPF
ncbi:MAG: phosphomannomutase/phosphoglucomutase [Chromatiaceae bacterium]|nr:phosphomannomutase/phosphoglucomutase [Chromatiaceae bacterium]